MKNKDPEQQIKRDSFIKSTLEIRNQIEILCEFGFNTEQAIDFLKLMELKDIGAALYFERGSIAKVLTDTELKAEIIAEALEKIPDYDGSIRVKGNITNLV